MKILEHRTIVYDENGQGKSGGNKVEVSGIFLEHQPIVYTAERVCESSICANFILRENEAKNLLKKLQAVFGQTVNG